MQDGAGQTYGRAVYYQNDGRDRPSGLRVFLEFGDSLGSTAFVVDNQFGEVVERPTYLAYGNAESDLRPAEWDSYREPYRYTGHDDDAEVGLVYHGTRYSIPMLGRWATPDPLEIHSAASQINPYAYARSSPLRFVDPAGLTPEGGFTYDGSGFSFDPGFGGWTGGGGGGSATSGASSGAWYPTLPGSPMQSSLALTPPQASFALAQGSAGPSAGLKLNLAPMAGPAIYTGGDLPIYAVATVATAAVGLAICGLGTYFAPEIFIFIDEEAIPTFNSMMVHGATMLNTAVLAEQGIVVSASAGTVTGVAVAAADELEPAIARVTQVAGEAAPRPATLYHYTTEEGLGAIVESGELNPSLKALNPADARYGNGQYLTDIIPGTRTGASLSATFLRVPGQGARFSHYVEINVAGLDVIEGRPGVFVILGETPLDISGRIMSFGESF